MKKVIISFIIVFAFLANVNVSAQIEIHSSGRVGVGTTIPTQELEVIGTIKANALTGTSTGGALRIQNTSGYVDIGPQNAGWAHFQTDRANFYFNKPIYLNDGILSSYATSNLYLRTNVTDRITILNSNGNVGIGMTPEYKLDVVGDTRIAGNIYLGSTPNFIGTTGNVPITFKVNNIVAGSTGGGSNYNVSFGYLSLGNSLTGANNTAVGIRTLYSNSGYYNSAIGVQALSSNTTGNCNTANGAEALISNGTGNNNTAIGFQALNNNRTGSNNTAIGLQALSSNGTGNYNTACGYYALIPNTTGNYNTAIGYYAIGNIDSLNNITAIGNGAVVTQSNQVVLGNSNITSIGGYAAWTNLSDGRTKKNIRSEVPGLAFINRLQPVTYNLDLNALDELQKSDDPKINALRDSLFMSRSAEEKAIEAKARANKEKQVYTGFIAQDVEKAAQSVGYDFSGVDAPENGKGAYGLRYAEFVVPLVKAVQELSEQNNQLQKQVDELKELVYRLTSKELNGTK